METYSRNRSKNVAEFNNTERMSLKWQEQTSVDGAQRILPLARQVLPTSDCTLQSNGALFLNPDDLHEIQVGSIYEIDHSKLPTRTPTQLESVRVVMVSEKTELNVSVRFPSADSLFTYFSKAKEMYPALDEKFVMGSQLARKVLFRRVPSQEFAEKKHLEGFWLVNSVSIGEFEGVISKKDTCLTSALNCNGMIQWGARRQVTFLRQHRENSNPQSSSSFITGGKVKREGDKVKDDNSDANEEEQEEGYEEAVTEDVHETKTSPKRKYSFRSVEKAKKSKREKIKQSCNTKPKTKCKEIVLKNPTTRWSAERYKLAEQNLLEVMKSKGAVFGNPILRPALRAEARKRIGDTGLLDHLLKHMAGKIAPSGAERFRRRHNADGAMEYWLESADLVNIRREAGVQDPYWTPPPGWKPGDCPTQDPICANTFKLMKEETSKIVRDMEENKNQLVEELAKLRREMHELVSKRKQEESQAIMGSILGAICQKLNLDTSMVPLKSDLDTTIVPLEKYEKELLTISGFLKRMEEDIGKLTSKIEEKTNEDSELIAAAPTKESCGEKEKKQEGEKKKALAGGEEGSGGAQAAERTAAAAEEKAAKIERLKSGFRICKPQGSFIWPNMARSNSDSNVLSPQVVVQLEDLFVVPTPPSVSSSSALPQLPYPRPHPASPLKPLPKRRALTVTVSTVSNAPRPYEDGGTSINLNEIPVNPSDAFVTPSRQTLLLPSMGKREMSNSPWEAVVRDGSISKGASTTSQRQQRGCSSSASPSSASALSAEEGTWLALATPNPASHDSTRG